MPLVELDAIGRDFDVSKPWLNRALEGEPRRILRAVDDVSLAIEKGETLALVGESGCGKSTIARLMVGLYRPTRGTMRFDGADLATPAGAAHRRRMQMIFQDPFASLNPRWRVRDIIAEPIRVLGLLADEEAIRARVGELLVQVRLAPEDAEKFPHEFSGGQRQRISIARALSGNPEFLVCDEPTSALDVSVQAQILNLMADLQESLGLTYLFISHNLAVVAHIADRVGVMYLGRLVELAPAEELFARPRHPYTRMLLRAVPRVARKLARLATLAGTMPPPSRFPAGCRFHPRCPDAIERCRAEAPALVDDGSGRMARCWRADETGLASEAVA